MPSFLRFRALLVGIFLVALGATTLVEAQRAATSGVDYGVWYGTADCADERRYYRLSLEPAGNRSRAVVDFLDGPGGQPWARAVPTVGYTPNRPDVFINVGNTWLLRPFDEPEWPGRLQTSEDWLTFTSRPFGSCEPLTLERAPLEAETGAVDSAARLPELFLGTLASCNSQISHRVALRLVGRGDSAVEGQIMLRADPLSPRAAEGTFEILGEFHASDNRLVMISDRLIEGDERRTPKFDFEAELRDGGRRLIANTTMTGCMLLDLEVPGSSIVDRVTRVPTERPILEWDDASACATFIDWSSQALAESGLDTLYSSISVGQVRELGIGILTDQRFVPFFGKPYESLSQAERTKLGALSEYCNRLRGMAGPFRTTGAHALATDFFGRVRPELAVMGTRVRLLQTRLETEMAELERQPVTESDIPELEARLAELPERFSELWNADLASARAMIEGKLDIARGQMVERIEREIAALSEDESGLAREDALRADIALLRSSRPSDQQSLDRRLSERLGEIADGLILALAEDFREAEPALNTLAAVRARLDSAWPRLGRHLGTGGAGLLTMNETLSEAADSLYPDFEARARTLMSDAASFHEREARYGEVLHLYRQVVPSANVFGAAFSRYSRLVESLTPVPTVDDLVAGDGSPTSLGIKLAVADYISSAWMQQASLFPPAMASGFLHLTGSVRVGSARKSGCGEAESSGYWCDYNLQLNGRVPFLDLLNILPFRARFTWQGSEWAVAEVGGQSRSGPPSDNEWRAYYAEQEAMQRRQQQEWYDRNVEFATMR